MTTAEPDLQARLDRLAQYFDLNALAQADCSAKGIQRYYRLSRHAYSRYNDKANAVHMGLSKDGTWRPEDMYGQASFVEDRLDGARNVLELATGRGMNSIWLARRNPDVQFHGLDLTPAQLAYAAKESVGLRNFTASSGDFHNLSAFESSGQDLVFVVEALCHSTRKDQVFREVHRALRPGGLFIVIDGYRTQGELSPTTEHAIRLLARGMAVPDFIAYEEFCGGVAKSTFQIVEQSNRSRQIMPSLRRFEALANRFMTSRLKYRLMRTLLPKPLLHNVVSGYLFPALMEAGAISYWLTVLRKDEH